MLKSQGAENGTIILKEVATGKIIASSAYVSRKTNKGISYVRDSVLINSKFEPGGLMIPVSVGYLLDNTNLDLIDSVDIERGLTTIGGLQVYDSEDHGLRKTSIKNVIEISSNVGIAKLLNTNVKSSAYANFAKSMNDYFFDTVYFGSIPHDAINLPFIAFGYGLMVSPNQILNFYNRVASNDQKLFIKQTTSSKVQAALVGVSQNGTARSLLRNSAIAIASKTGTSLAVGKNGYANKQYYSSVVGYAPIENPKYSCIVVIKCKPNSPLFYGSVVAGPVFKDVLNEACK
jgi:cell division protein FtsI (penicillin-binding protein 3)